MHPWEIFLIGAVLISALATSSVVWSRRRARPPEAKRNYQDVRLLWFFLYLAALSLLGYVSFVFGKR
jgi:hypothetical protein